MPLKLASFKDTNVSTLNRWADDIETQLGKTQKSTQIALQSASTASQVEIEVNGVPQSNQELLNIAQGTGVTITGNSAGKVTINATATGDGLTHGETPWETDPSYVFIRDDFVNDLTASTTYQPFGSMSWGAYFFSSAGGGNFTWAQDGFPNFGVVELIDAAVVNSTCTIAPSWLNIAAGASGGVQNYAWPLLDYAGWQVEWVFCLRLPTAGFGTGSPAMNLNKSSNYVGLACWLNTATNNSPRPQTFLGVRYDTDPGFAISCTTVANASGGTTVYSGLSVPTGGQNNYLVGSQITMSGFGANNNNGTFIVTAVTSSSITVNNALGSSASGQTGTCTTPALSDSTLMMECTLNYQNGVAQGRQNQQGVNGGTFNTGITPVDGTWYRLTISCSTVGTINMSLSGGGQTVSNTFTISRVVITSTGNGTGVNISNGRAQYVTGNLLTTAGSPPFTAAYIGWSRGSKAVVTFASQSVNQGTFLVQQGLPANAAWNFICADTTQIGQTAPSTLTVTGYPALIPYASHGVDSESSSIPAANTRCLAIDYFSFVWNPALSAAGGTPNSNLARYW